LPLFDPVVTARSGFLVSLTIGLDRGRQANLQSGRVHVSTFARLGTARGDYVVGKLVGLGRSAGR